MLNSMSSHEILVGGGGCGCGGGGGSGDGHKASEKSPQENDIMCTICLEYVVDDGERAWTKLKCGHFFHLDCIGSAFNSKGTMECPNCRVTENGEWRFASGSLTNLVDEIFNFNVRSTAFENLVSTVFRPTFRIDFGSIIETNTAEANRRRDSERSNRERSNRGRSNRNNNSGDDGVIVGPRIRGLEQRSQRPRTSRGRFGPSAPLHPLNRQSNQRNATRAPTNESQNHRRIWRPVRAPNAEAEVTAVTAATAATSFLPDTNNEGLLQPFVPQQSQPITTISQWNNRRRRSGRNTRGRNAGDAASAAPPNRGSSSEPRDEELTNLSISGQEELTSHPEGRRNAETAAASSARSGASHQRSPRFSLRPPRFGPHPSTSRSFSWHRNEGDSNRRRH